MTTLPTTDTIDGGEMRDRCISIKCHDDAAVGDASGIECIVERGGGAQFRYDAAPALFAGAVGNALPVPAFLLQSRAFELHHAAMREHRRYPCDAKFGGLLDHDVHAFPA